MTNPSRAIRRAAVIGAGTMGAGIAAQLASVGIQVELLDVVPDALTQVEASEGLGLADPNVRNRIAADGWARARASRPASEISSEAAQRVSVRNLEDDLGRLGQADWIIEAVVEDLPVKRQIMAMIDAARTSRSVVSTNTSGIPIREIGEGRSDEFNRHFLGTHFFNPPLLMKIVEVIPGLRTDRNVVDSMSGFIENRLEKGVVVCKDTPNFIANRVASLQSSFDMDYALAHGYTVAETDAILGTIVGRPSTAVFRLRDLVGLDVSTRVAENLYAAIPHDKFRHILMGPRLSALRTAMIGQGLLGRKSGGGFYRELDTAHGRRYRSLDLTTLEYGEPQFINLPTLSQAAGIDGLVERLRFIVSKSDRVGELVWASLSHVMAYAAYCLPEIADELHPVDKALRLGYSWQLGPFEIWDALGVPATLERMKHGDLVVAEWVEEMLDSGRASFYKTIGGLAHTFSPVVKEYLPLERSR